MASDFTRHHGLSHKLFSAGDAVGFTPTMWNTLAEQPKLFQSLVEVMEGRSHIVPMPLFKRLAPIVLPARLQATDPAQAFAEGKKGLWVSLSFRSRILPALKPVEAVPERVYHVDELQRPALDSVIRDDLRPSLGRWEDLISFIELHPTGTPGYFLIYLEGVAGEVFAVNFYWDADRHVWVVSDWGLGENGHWLAGVQVLSPANSQPL